MRYNLSTTKRYDREFARAKLTAELTLNEKTHQWEVRTAQPRSDVEKDKLLWRKENGKPAKSLP